MTFIKQFSKFSLEKLIAISELNSDYSDEAKNAALTIIELKEPNDVEIKTAAIEYWEKKIDPLIKNLVFQKEIPCSNFLNKEEITEIMKIAFDKWKEKQKLLGIDITKYWAFPM